MIWHCSDPVPMELAVKQIVGRNSILPFDPLRGTTPPTLFDADHPPKPAVMHVLAP
jgi:hypothetical protein